MILYFAGNFEYLGKVEKEMELANICLQKSGAYNRLSSFFFRKETDNVLKVVEELKQGETDEGENRGT